ncbi:MAG: gamma-glutamylcyclotransferase [Thiohalorhabdus sp.]
MRIFVYGTLKPGHANWERALGGRVEHWRPARVRGRLFDLPLGFPAAVRGPGWIHGCLLHLPPEYLPVVDAIEGYAPDRRPECNTYQRLEVPAFSPEGIPLGRAQAYFMDEEPVRRLGGTGLPGGQWPPGKETERPNGA